MATIICRKVSFGYDGTERNLFTDLDLLIDTGRRSALAGRKKIELARSFLMPANPAGILSPDASHSMYIPRTLRVNVVPAR